MTSTRTYFEKHARTVDRQYTDGNGARRFLQPGPLLGLKHAVSVANRYAAPTCLDVGCGTGRVAEAVMDAGAVRYVGIDLSPRMLAYARARLEQFDAVELHEGDFLDLDVPQTFDVVLALGLFDYLEDPSRAADWLRARCSSTLVASFTRWDWVKGPIRHLHYDVVHRCRVFDYTEARVQALLTGAGFSTVELVLHGRRGFIVEAAP